MEALASTIAELLSMNGVCLVLYNPGLDGGVFLGPAAAVQFAAAGGLAPWHGDDLGFAPRRVDGLKLYAVERADAAPPSPIFRPILVSLPTMPVEHVRDCIFLF